MFLKRFRRWKLSVEVIFHDRVIEAVLEDVELVSVIYFHDHVEVVEEWVEVVEDQHVCVCDVEEDVEIVSS